MIELIAALVIAHAPVPGAVNPAVTMQNISTTICSPKWVRAARPSTSYTDPIKFRLLAALQVPRSQAHLYELDHRVPIEAGGDPRSPRQLWIEPWAGTRGAHAKDRLENAVHRDICAGRLSLRAGQAIFLGDWWAEYDRRFGKERP